MLCVSGLKEHSGAEGTHHWPSGRPRDDNETAKGDENSEHEEETTQFEVGGVNEFLLIFWPFLPLLRG